VFGADIHINIYKIIMVITIIIIHKIFENNCEAPWLLVVMINELTCLFILFTLLIIQILISLKWQNVD
jgi:hypothetical protein